jgi:hypothetical protein
MHLVAEVTVSLVARFRLCWSVRTLRLRHARLGAGASALSQCPRTVQAAGPAYLRAFVAGFGVLSGVGLASVRCSVA